MRTETPNPFHKEDQTLEFCTKGLPQKYLVSPEIFADEQAKIFSKQWLVVGRQSQITKAGDYFVVDVAGESLIVNRDQRGTVRGFYNVCRHRGTRLKEDVCGHASSIQCPYHAWTYGLDGRLIGAPHMDEVPGFDKGEYSLHPVNLGIWEGFIFVNFTSLDSLTSVLSHAHSSALTGAARPSLPEGEKRERRNGGGHDSKPAAASGSGYKTLEEWFAPLNGKFSHWNMSILRAAKRVEYDVRANWKLMFENYSECYHCPGVHPTLSKISPYDSAVNDLAEGPFLGGFMKINQGKSLTMSGNACAVPLGKEQEKEHEQERAERVFYYSIFPNMLLSMHPDYVMVHQLWPQSPDRTLILCDWFFHPDAFGRKDFRPEDAIEFWDMTNKQDWHVCELSQSGIASRAYVPGPYSARESIPAAFDKYYLQQMG